MELQADCPSFIDLAAFASTSAADVPIGAGGFGRRMLPLRSGPVEVGSLHFPAGSGQSDGQPGDEFLIVAQGEIRITVNGRAVALAAGDSAVLVSGAAFAWSATAPATLVFMRYVNGAGGEARAVPIDPAAPLEPSGAPLAELLIGETPACRNNTAYKSDDGEFTCGVWDSTPYHRRAMPYRHFELMYLLRGSVTFVDELDRARTFRKGDIFLIEQHAQCSWESREDVAKVYAIYRPV